MIIKMVILNVLNSSILKPSKFKSRGNLLDFKEGGDTP